jgi:hypothetical protein
MDRFNPYYHGWISAILICGFEMIWYKMLLQIQTQVSLLEQNPDSLNQSWVVKFISINLY